VSAKKKSSQHGLGKGIDSLLGGFDFDDLSIERGQVGKSSTPAEEESSVKIEDVGKSEVVKYISIDSVQPNPNQPRKAFDDSSLAELAESIKKQGVLQPLIVEEYAPGKYTIIAGERRYRAAKIAKLSEIPVLVRNFNELQRIEVALIENIQRENLNPIDEATAYSFLIQKSGMTQEEVAERVGKNRSTISNSLRLLQLPDEMKDDVISGALTSGHAKAILSLVNPSDRVVLRNRIIENELSVREAEAEAEKLNGGKKLIAKKKEPVKNQYVQEVEDKFLQAFGTKVEVKGNLKKGKLIIPYRAKSELESIYQLLVKDGELFTE